MGRGLARRVGQVRRLRTAQGPVSGIAGGRIPAVDRVEWSIIKDATTALAALSAGELDYWDSPPADLVPVIKANPGLVAQVRNTSGSYTMLQFNHLQPPFNDLAIRRAVAMAVDQTRFLQAAVSQPDMMRPCASYYACGTPYGSEAAGGILATRSIDQAKAALQATRYAGESVVILGVIDSPVLAAMCRVAEEMLRRIGMTVTLVETDFASMAQRRVSREPVDKGGWSAFVTQWTGTDILNPAVNQLLRGAGTSGWFGWAKDDALEDLRNQWFDATDADTQARLAAAIQVEAFKNLPYIPLGATTPYVAYSKQLTGVFPSPVAAYWNIGKAV